MAAPNATEPDFIRLFEEIGPAALAKRLGISESNVFKRRRVLERKHGRPIIGPAEERNRSEPITPIPGRLHTNVEDGVVLVGSDLHAWPGEPSTAFRGFLRFIQEFQPKVVVLNGDVIDGASISRHPPLGWEKRPTLIEELEAAAALLHQVELVAPDAELYWPAGNHDQRLETRIATVAPEFAKVHGVHLKDHFGPRWQPCWSVWINNDVVVKHRARGGIHAPWNNTLNSGKTIVTGHLHSAKVIPLNDYSDKTRYGVDTGCLADVHHQAFSYLEDNFVNWRSGFAVLTFIDGELLQPELALVWDKDTIQFRGTLLRV
jgi:hypothetical protein